MTFYKGAVPSNILLSNPIGDTVYGSNGKEKAPTLLSTYANWIDLAAYGALGGTFSLNTDAKPLFQTGVPASGGLCDTKVLAFSAYDFRGEYNGSVPRTDALFYEPFSQLGPDNNCPESGNTATKGLVMSTLTNGLLAMNKSHPAACGIDTQILVRYFVAHQRRCDHECE
jgi:hypothetical protein